MIIKVLEEVKKDEDKHGWTETLQEIYIGTRF